MTQIPVRTLTPEAACSAVEAAATSAGLATWQVETLKRKLAEAAAAPSGMLALATVDVKWILEEIPELAAEQAERLMSEDWGDVAHTTVAEVMSETLYRKASALFPEVFEPADSPALGEYHG